MVFVCEILGIKITQNCRKKSVIFFYSCQSNFTHKQQSVFQTKKCHFVGEFCVRNEIEENNPADLAE
jgi:hypothetical protein